MNANDLHELSGKLAKQIPEDITADDLLYLYAYVARHFRMRNVEEMLWSDREYFLPEEEVDEHYLGETTLRALRDVAPDDQPEYTDGSDFDAPYLLEEDYFDNQWQHDANHPYED